MSAQRSPATQGERNALTEAERWVAWRAVVRSGRALVRSLEACWVTLHWLDPRFHSQRLRLRAVTEGRLDKRTGKVALLLLYPQGPLAAFTESLVGALNRSDFDLVLVVNGRLDAPARNALLERCCLLIERANIGRDFGGYQDGIAIVLQRRPGLQRLLLANDSVFYLPQGLDDMIAALDCGAAFTGVSEVFEVRHHVASFLVSFGPEVIESDAFRNFWERYRPVGTRRWAILHGEHELTHVLKAAGFAPSVLYRTESLRSKLQQRSAAELEADAGALPPAARLRLQAGSAGLADAIVDAVKARNQMHYGGFLFRRHLGSPLVKRDLVYRGVYPPGDLMAQLGDLDAPMRDAIAADLASRPAPSLRRPLRWLMHQYGAV
jgi:hypothetical protein